MRKPLPVFVIAIFVLIGAWAKRVLIVIPTQFHPQFPIQNVPESFHHYVPTYTELTITLGTFAIAILIITLLVRVFPVVPIWEVAEEHENHEATATKNIK